MVTTAAVFYRHVQQAHVGHRAAWGSSGLLDARHGVVCPDRGVLTQCFAPPGVVYRGLLPTGEVRTGGDSTAAAVP